MNKIMDLINDFYDNVAVEYSNYHNKVTSPSLFKAIFKKVNEQQIINEYFELLTRLKNILNESTKLSDSSLKKQFIIELNYFKSLLECEINLYKANKHASNDMVNHFSKKKLKIQEEFLKHDSSFRLLLQKETKKQNQNDETQNSKEILLDKRELTDWDWEMLLREAMGKRLMKRYPVENTQQENGKNLKNRQQQSVDEKIKVTKEQYSYILFETVRISSQDFYVLCNELQIENDMVNYLIYYEYILCLTEKILQKKHSKEMLKIYIDGVWEWLKKFALDKYEKNDREKVLKIIDNLKDIYMNLNLAIDDISEKSIHELTDIYLQAMELGNGGIEHYNIFLSFSSYITYNSSDLLNNNFEIEE